MSLALITSVKGENMTRTTLQGFAWSIEVLFRSGPFSCWLLQYFWLEFLQQQIKIIDLRVA